MYKIISLFFLIVFHPYIAAEFYLSGILRTADLKWIAIFQPVIRHFYLIAVLNLLLEHPVTIADAAAVSRITKRCQRVQEAGGKAAQTAVAQRGIPFLVLNGIQVAAQLLQCFFHFIIIGQVDQIVAKSPPHEKFHRHVIHGLRISFLDHPSL